MSPPVIELRDVELTLQGNAGPVKILRGVTMAALKGETLGLVGPSGSGKSSLLMLMGGLETATGGSVRVLGQDFTAMGEDALARFRRDHMGVVFQSFHLIPTMTALENVATPLELAGAEDAFARAEEELRAVGLGARMDHYPAQLSGGEQQRVAIVRALLKRPDWLFLDEATAALDEPMEAQVYALLRTRLPDTTLVSIGHRTTLLDFHDRRIEMRQGADGSFVPAEA
ncbi:ABC transporter [Amaricoccus sp. HAR-UPW-R2A-40]|nr:ABC transporter [Amaricoccus sp. HAR-UPW-R2A-40]